MSKHHSANVSQLKASRSKGNSTGADRKKPSATTEALRKGFAEAVVTAVEEHRTAGRPVHEAEVKRRRPR